MMQTINTFSLIRRAIFTSLGAIDNLLGRKSNLFVLCYHAIGNDSWRFGISKEDFELQMKLLLQTYQNVSIQDIEKHIRGEKTISKPSFAITFDDGYRDIMEVQDIISSLKLNPTVFILGDKLNADRHELENVREFLSDRDIVKIKKLGWDIQCHTMTHTYLPKSNNLSYEIVNSKKKIKKDFGILTKYIAYPKGGYSPEIIEIVKEAGYKMALSMDDGVINTNTNIFAVPRIGVDRTHSFQEFKVLFSPTVITVRGLIKRIFFMKNIHFKLYPNLIRDIKLLYRDPKAFLYSFTFPTDEYVHILPFNPEINLSGNSLVRKIHKAHPKLVVHFVGSASLEIPGHSDIDLLAECTPESFDKYIPALKKIFGADFKRRPQFVEWHTTYKGSDVQFMLIDPKHRTFKDLMKVYSLFKSDKSLLEGYKKVKLECQGQSLREYKRRRMEFFNQIMLSH